MTGDQPDGKRTSKTVGGTTTNYVYDVNRSLPVVLDDGTRKYVWGLGLAYAVDTNGAIRVYHTDGLGSVRAITNAAASVVQTYTIDEFGVPTQTQGSSTQPFQYTGEQRDAESGFVYLRARVYDPQIGRFLQRDPSAGQIGAPITLHRFIYANNNPASLVDPSGFGAEGSQKVLKNDICTDQTNPLHVLCGDLVARLNPVGVRPMSPLERDFIEWLAGKLGADTARYADDAVGGSGGAASNPARGRFDQNHSRYDDALRAAREQAGDLGNNTWKMYDPKTGTLIAEQSADGTRGWRIDADHINWWDWSGGKKGTGGRYGHEFFPPSQSGPHSEYIGYAEWQR